MRPSTLSEARLARDRAVEIFGRLAPVVGVGITHLDGGYGVKVNLRELPPGEVELPDEIDGVPVRVAVVGALRAY